MDMWDQTHRAPQAKALLVQLMKTLHQVAVDKGSWEVGSLFLLQPDPLALAEFGGEEKEMEDVYRYRKGVRELRARHTTAKLDDPPNGDQEDGEEGGAEKDKFRRRKPKAKPKADA